MISCQSCQELLPEFSLGQLDAGDQRKVKFHVKRCRACAVELAEVRRVWSMIPLALEPVEPTEEIKVQLIDRVRTSAKVKRREKRLAAQRRPVNWSISAKNRHFMIAASILAALIGISSLFWPGSTSSDQSNSVADTLAERRIETLAKSLGRKHQIVDDTGRKSFVFVQFNQGLNADSINEIKSAKAYAIFDRVTRRIHVYAVNLPGNASDYSLQFTNKRGSLIASRTLTQRDENISSAIVQATSQYPFASATIVAGASGSASAAILQADWLIPIEQDSIEIAR